MTKEKGSYLIFLILFGCVCLTVTGKWGLYAEPLQKAGDWCMIKLGLPLPGREVSGIPDKVWEAETAVSPETGEKTGESGLTPTGTEAADAAEMTGAGAATSNVSAADGRLTDTEGIGTAAQGIVYHSVEDDYFADAVFIGDSRTVGMYEYGGLEDISTFYCSTGLTVYKMFTAKIAEAPGQKKKQTVEEALTQRQFSAIYLMIGINEMGTGTVASFTEAYRGCVEHLRELQPDAVIYIQGIMRVTNERSDKGDYITNEGIDVRNEELAKLADNEHVFYLDVNPLICDDSDGLVANYTYDGVHLKAQYISLWKDYLKSHVRAIAKS